MSLFITSLNSGSNGNCYYVGNHTEAVLVDAGISCRETEKRVARLGLSFNKIKALFISHEHIDHISGVAAIAKKYKLPVYITKQTLIGSRLKLDESCVRNFISNEPLQIGALTITAFAKQHDACHPHSFTISSNGITVGVFTDIGKVCKELVKHFRLCHAAFLETNYDDELLENGNYPYHLKKRIKGDQGHLSNVQALELFKKHKPKFMSHLLLSHLSRDNNNPELVQKLFTKQASGTTIIVASRYTETEIFHITGAINTTQKLKTNAVRAEQLTLF